MFIGCEYGKDLRSPLNRFFYGEWPAHQDGENPNRIYFEVQEVRFIFEEGKYVGYYIP